MFSEESFCVMGLDSTYANKASPPTPLLAISITPFTFGVKSLMSAVGMVGASSTGAMVGDSSGGGSFIFADETSVGVGSNFDKSAGGPTGVGLL